MFIEAKDDGGGGGNWSYIVRAKLQSSHYHQQTNAKSFLQSGCPSCHPTNSVKALKGKDSLDVNVTYADDDEGGGAIEHAQCHDPEDNSVEEVSKWEAEQDGQDAADGEPERERRQNQHEYEDHRQRDDCQADVMPVRTAHLVVEYVVSTV